MFSVFTVITMFTVVRYQSGVTYFVIMNNRGPVKARLLSYYLHFAARENYTLAIVLHYCTWSQLGQLFYGRGVTRRRGPVSLYGRGE